MPGKLIVRSQRINNCVIFVGPSLNKEVSVRVSKEFINETTKQFPVIIYGEKNIVRRVEESSVEPGKQRYTIILNTGEKMEFIADNILQSVAGTAVNIAEVLSRAFQIRDVGIFGAIGDEQPGAFISNTLQRDGFELFLFRRDQTAFTLSLQDENGIATLFCEKPPYSIHEETVEEMSYIQPRILICSSIRPDDLDLVEKLFSQPRKEVTKVFIPHLELLKRQDLRERVEKVIMAADIIQMNEMEAKILLGVESFEANMIGDFGKYQTSVFIVTLGINGSVTIFKDGEKIIQSGFVVAEPKDTTGAGDVHMAAFLYFHVLRELRPPRKICLKMASWVASCKVARQGPYCGLPAKEDRRKKLYEFWPEGQKA
jgi:sugar/nucleoside kinase (ribokinase family)